MDTETKIDGPLETLLLTEGPDDLRVIQSLLRVYRYTGQIRIQHGEGYPQLRKELKPILEDSVLRRVGILIDADDNLSGRWTSIRDRLRQCGCLPPDELPEAGAIFPGPDGMSVGVWIIPNNALTGALEAFLSLLVPVADQNWSYAETCVAGIPQKPKTSQNWDNKAILHTWLAWQEYPGKEPEQAFVRRYLDPKAEAAQALVAWLERLFELKAESPNDAP